MVVVFESDRLLFRLFTLEDAPLIYDLNRDPEVTRFTHDPMNSVEQAAEVLTNVILPQYVMYYHGRWAVHVKHDLRFIGWCGLKYRPELKEIDLGYRFRKTEWRQGFATEAAFASIRYGFDKLGMLLIRGRAEVGNTGSIRVLEKCGMKYVGKQVIDGHLARTYELSNPLVS